MNAPDVPPVTPPQPATDNRQSDPPQQRLLGLLAQLEAFLDDVMIKKAPFQIPKDIKELIATVGPYLVIVGIALFALSLLALLGMGAILGSMGTLGTVGVGWSFGAIVSLVAGVAALALEVMALPGLFKRTTASWRLVFYASCASIAGSLLSFHIVGAVVSAVIGWYVLFQVKELYRN
jgi:hypothetical protein